MSKKSYLEIDCRDPIVSRDSRPFGIGQGFRMHSAGWPSPSVVAGSLRTCLAKSANRAFTPETCEALQQVQVAGLFPMVGAELYLPAPHDQLSDRDNRLHPLRPAKQLPEGAGCDLPHEKLRPIQAEAELQVEKYAAAPAWWPLSRYQSWLMDPKKPFLINSSFLLDPECDERIHVKLNPQSGSAEDGILFTTKALPLTHLRRFGIPDGDFSAQYAEIRLATRVVSDDNNDWCGKAARELGKIHPLGGERRLAHWKASKSAQHWKIPHELSKKLERSKTVRMVLSTPALFDNGWQPGWLNADLIGKPPGTQLELQLVGFCSQHWRPISGWSLAQLKDQPSGPKPLRRMVPAGAVYFFKVHKGNPDKLAQRWLTSVSDNPQDRSDGFGLACWGIW